MRPFFTAIGHALRILYIYTETELTASPETFLPHIPQNAVTRVRLFVSRDALCRCPGNPPAHTHAQLGRSPDHARCVQRLSQLAARLDQELDRLGHRLSGRADAAPHAGAPDAPAAAATEPTPPPPAALAKPAVFVSIAPPLDAAWRTGPAQPPPAAAALEQWAGQRGGGPQDPMRQRHAAGGGQAEGALEVSCPLPRFLSPIKLVCDSRDIIEIRGVYRRREISF